MLAECLVLGKAVLATGWSGNMEFMSGVPQALLPFTLVPVQDSANVYKGQSEQNWADVDVAKAALILRDIASGQTKIDFQPAQKKMHEISERWGRKSLNAMTMTDWLVSEA